MNNSQSNSKLSMSNERHTIYNLNLTRILVYKSIPVSKKTEPFFELLFTLAWKQSEIFFSNNSSIQTADRNRNHTNSMLDYWQITWETTQAHRRPLTR